MEYPAYRRDLDLRRRAAFHKRTDQSFAVWRGALAGCNRARPRDCRAWRCIPGLPGIVAASFGAQVVQSDRQALALSVCQRNGALNGLAGVEYRLADWTAWDDDTRYDMIIGADILYGAALHPYLRQIFADNLAPGGRILLADPFRDASLRLLEALEAEGWAISMSKWSVGEDAAPRAIGVFEIARL